MAKNLGIDYGAGLTNVDYETGIRYGVISQNEVLQAWADSSEPQYIYMCPKCSAEFAEMPEKCDKCGQDFDNLYFDNLEPVFYYIDDSEYLAASDDYGDIFITKSPYYTRCQFASPCAPGAGYLMNYMEEGIKAYCFGHDWFEDGKAPYPVYSVLTDELINP